MEARYLKELLQRMLGGHVRVFLDSAHLTDLRQLFSQGVQKSDVVVVLGTRGVLLRPACLLEIFTAHVSGIPTVVVGIQDPGGRAGHDAAIALDFLEGLPSSLEARHPTGLRQVENYLEHAGVSFEKFKACLLEAIGHQFQEEAMRLRPALTFNGAGTDHQILASCQGIINEMALATDRPMLKWRGPSLGSTAGGLPGTSSRFSLVDRSFKMKLSFKRTGSGRGESRRSRAISMDETGIMHRHMEKGIGDMLGGAGRGFGGAIDGAKDLVTRLSAVNLGPGKGPTMSKAACENALAHSGGALITRSRPIEAGPSRATARRSTHRRASEAERPIRPLRKIPKHKASTFHIAFDRCDTQAADACRMLAMRLVERTGSRVCFDSKQLAGWGDLARDPAIIIALSQAMEQRLNQLLCSRCVIFVQSRDALRHGSALLELHWAVAAGIPVIPLRLDSYDFADAMLLLSRLHELGSERTLADVRAKLMEYRIRLDAMRAQLIEFLPNIISIGLAPSQNEISWDCCVQDIVGRYAMLTSAADRTKQACELQARTRGFLEKRRWWKTRESATKLQAVLRGKSGRSIAAARRSERDCIAKSGRPPCQQGPPSARASPHARASTMRKSVDRDDVGAPAAAAYTATMAIVTVADAEKHARKLAAAVVLQKHGRGRSSRRARHDAHCRQ